MCNLAESCVRVKTRGLRCWRDRAGCVLRMAGSAPAAGVWRNGSASNSRSEGWEFEPLCPHAARSFRSCDVVMVWRVLVACCLRVRLVGALLFGSGLGRVGCRRVARLLRRVLGRVRAPTTFEGMQRPLALCNSQLGI